MPEIIIINFFKVLTPNHLFPFLDLQWLHNNLFIPEYVFNTSSLPKESIDDWSARRDNWSFQQVAQQWQNGMKSLKFSFLWCT